MRSSPTFVFATLLTVVATIGSTSLAADASAVAHPPGLPLRVLDMVHYNPGEPPYSTQYADPEVVRQMGFNGKVYFLFDSPTLAIDWEAVDPDIFPKGSPGRAWVDTKAARIDAQHAACKAAGLKVYAMGDLVLFPKRLVEKYGLQKTFGNPQDPNTDKFLRKMLDQVFRRFPALDGLVVRIGETYLQDAPHHVGHIQDKTDPERTIIPLVRLLREEICVERHKELVFRTWMSFDTNLNVYRKVSDAIEPHPGLAFGVKHCEGDFHRGNPFSKVIGEGRHPQIIEVQCAREYEGKGAYPNYVARGVIEGFEEHQALPAGAIRSIGQFARQRPELFAGVWTWSRGGGWQGPFVKHELWPDLNAWVVAQWARDPRQTEEAVFRRYAAERLALRGDDVDKFRKLCLLSADAVVRGRQSLVEHVDCWWTRDQYMAVPPLPKKRENLAPFLQEKQDAVAMWRSIVELGDGIRFADKTTADAVRVSTRYGLHLYRIYGAAFHLAALGPAAGPAELHKWIAEYDAAWADLRRLPEESPLCATLYEPRHSPWHGSQKHLDAFVDALRSRAGAQR